ncbi:hypothetical protein SAMN04488044_2714 [Cognatishimia maritima]|uniref:Uncharacterized protein n=1 Tax=Cognatishimia maritima TaxID=870908 RepID=A0A1M5TWW1_9RHOB|nr:hypothetical protein SAMN04488044_2714 [Cognatishimia maritima]
MGFCREFFGHPQISDFIASKPLKPQVSQRLPDLSVRKLHQKFLPCGPFDPADKHEETLATTLGIFGGKHGAE